jgi:periplasmic divalent cation tolerance protein
MTDKVIVFVTCETKQQAEHIAETVVKDKLAACVNIVPGIRSCYTWEGKTTWGDEVLCLIKTTRGRFGELREKIRELHSYSVPEIASVSIDEAYGAYLDWVDECVGG